MRNEAQGGLGNHPEQALAADHEADQIKAGLVLVAAAAGAHDGAVGQHGLQPEHVVAGDAVLQAARAAGVGGDVAAEAALLQAGRVGRIKPAELAHGLLQVAGGDAGFNDRDAVGGVNLLDAVHAPQRQGDATLQRHATADVTDAGALRRHRHAMRIGVAQHGGDVLGRGGVHDHLRRVGREPFVGAMGGEVGGRGRHSVGSEQGGKVVSKAGHRPA